MNTLGIILARAGSVGLRIKHLLPLMGRPVIEYTFDHAVAAKRLSRVVVSTDCPRIKKLASARRLETLDRPAELATGDASVQDVCLHAMDSVEARSPFRADAIVVLYGNVPVRPADIVDRAIAHLQETGCDSVRSLTPVGKWHPAWMHRLEGDRMHPLAAGSIHRRQDLEPIYLHDGAAVAASRAAFERARSDRQDPHAFFGTDRRGVVSEMDQTVEIDHQRDLFWAEAVLKARGLGEDRWRLAS